MKDMLQKLKLVYWAIAGALLLFAFIIEFFLLDIAGGMLANNHQFDFVCQTLAVLLTLSVIYFSLKLFKIEKIATKLKEHPEQYYLSYSIVRLVMLEVPLLFNLLCYFFFINSSYAWLGVIIGLAFPFVYPSEERYINETGQQ